MIPFTDGLPLRLSEALLALPSPTKLGPKT